MPPVHKRSGIKERRNNEQVHEQKVRRTTTTETQELQQYRPTDHSLPAGDEFCEQRTSSRSSRAVTQICSSRLIEQQHLQTAKQNRFEVECTLTGRANVE